MSKVNPSPKKVELSPEQKEKLEKLWFIFGNHGPKTTMSNHRFIQCLLEDSKDYRKFFKPTKECLAEVDKILG